MGSLAVFSPLLVVSLLAVSQMDFNDAVARANAARQAGDRDGAITLYSHAVQLNPQFAEGWRFVGELSAEEERFTSCRDALVQFVRLESTQAPGWSTLGLCEFETGDRTASLEHIRRALSMRTALPAEMVDVLRFHEALLLTREGQFDIALRSYREIVRSGPLSDTFVEGLGLAALNKPLMPDEVAADQHNLYRMAGIAIGKSMTGDNDGAEAELRELLRHYPASTDVQYLYGMCLLRVRPDEGVVQLRNILQTHPERADIRADIAYSLMKRGEAGRAWPFAERAAVEAPLNPLAQYVYGCALAARGDLRNGIVHLEQATNLDPGSLDCHVALAAAYSRMGRPLDSRRERLESIALARASGEGG